MPRFIALCFIAFVKKLKVCGSNALSKSIGAIFPTAFAHFVSLTHFGNSCNISNFFIIMVFVMVIHDQWSSMLLLQKDDDPLKA